ncbi:MAG: adenosylcobinamide-phosphate synthase CbiB [Clostridia bacterium]|jgi:adenosylcobinamide-phosphate synthase|nr:adenosylcobinamide-phosphate synthase CbiB [Clostridia bacterium]
MDTIIAVIAGFIIDFLIGDPHFLPHPVKLIGIIISKTESILRKKFKTEKGLEIAGVILVIIVILLTFLASYYVIFAFGIFGKLAKRIVMSIMCWQVIAARSLQKESMKVYDELENGTLGSARKAVSMIVGRDTENLSDEGVTKAAIETVAENTSDGVIAPMFYIMIGGPILGMVYKAVNTMDSMVGYKNEKYLHFGRAAAKTDDFFNFLPSRIAAMLMIVSTFFLRYDIKNAVYIFKRDRFNHSSPNAAQTESVCAGALELKLAGDAWYFGKLVKKEYIGDDLRPIDHSDIKRANKMMYLSSILALILILVVRVVIWKIWKI